MKVYTIGSERLTAVHTANGVEVPMTDANRDFGEAVEQDRERGRVVKFQSGVTVSLGNYEFARIAVGAESTVDGDFDEALGVVRAFVRDVLNREEALVRKKDGPTVIPADLPGRARSIWVEYGLTLNGKAKFESNKVDIGLSRPLGDGENAADVVGEIQEYLSRRVGEERDNYRGKV